MQVNILISGTGGQGIVASGEFLSQALFLDGYEVIFGRSYGSEARGGSCRSEIMVSDQEIYNLQFEESDILLCLSIPAYHKYIDKAREGSLTILDENIVNDVKILRKDIKIISVPARDKAIELGNQIVANMVMLGALAKVSNIVRLELLNKAVDRYMRPSMKQINHKALEAGYRSIQEL
jgi:2-oxoglutarate ferredoxin oxidoreductase subunit gamma